MTTLVTVPSVGVVIRPPLSLLSRREISSSELVRRCAPRALASSSSSSSSRRLDFGPKVENDVLFGHLVPDPVHRHLLVLFDVGALWLFVTCCACATACRVAGQDDDVAIVRDADLSLVDRDDGRGAMPRDALLGQDVLAVDGAHPLARRRRHARHGRVQAVEVPVLVAEIARDDAAVHVRVRRLAAVVADDRATILVLQPVPVSVLLSNRSTPFENHARQKSLEGEGEKKERKERKKEKKAHVIFEGGRCSFESINSPLRPTATVREKVRGFASRKERDSTLDEPFL